MRGPPADAEGEYGQQHADDDKNDSYTGSLSNLEGFEGGLIIQIQQRAGGAGGAALGQHVDLIVGLKGLDKLHHE
ncbi:hypothetical protein D3C81_2184640 [compost metagenome]